MPEFRKISLNLSDEDLQRVEHLAKRLQISKTEVVRRAIATELFVFQTYDKGGQVFIQTEDKKLHGMMPWYTSVPDGVLT